MVEACESNEVVEPLGRSCAERIRNKLPGKVARVIAHQKYTILLYSTVKIFHKVSCMLIVVFNII